jgi:hypothetical protein
MLWATVHGIVALHVVMSGDEWMEWRDPRETAAEMRRAMRRGIVKLS